MMRIIIIAPIINWKFEERVRILLMAWRPRKKPVLHSRHDAAVEGNYRFKFKLSKIAKQPVVMVRQK
jgi:hypothetical protein